jgi:hypothetical protein
MDQSLAICRLIAYVAGIGLCLHFALVPEIGPTRVDAPGTLRDVDVFDRIVNHVRAGEAFHDATHRELRAHRYPTRSAFNWRTPTYAWWLASPIGSALGRWGLVLVSAAVCLIAGKRFLDEQGLIGGGLGSVFLVGSVAWCFGDKAWYHTELWAGSLVALSMLEYDAGRWRLGVALGLLALFFRELALPYPLVCLGLAIAARRRTEAIAWGLGLSTYCLFFAWHASCVSARVSTGDLAFAEGWVRLGGIPFVLQTARANIFLASFPLWCVALYLPTALFGMMIDGTESGRRLWLTVGVYLAGFCVVGHPMNFYWGWNYAPLLALGAARAPRALAEAVTSARFGSPQIGMARRRG